MKRWGLGLVVSSVVLLVGCTATTKPPVENAPIETTPSVSSAPETPTVPLNVLHSQCSGAFQNQEYAKAVEVCQPLVDIHDNVGLNVMGIMNTLGLGVPENRDAGLALFQRAVRQGDAQAAYYIGVGYWDGTFGTHSPQDREHGKNFIEAACKANFQPACEALELIQN